MEKEIQELVGKISDEHRDYVLLNIDGDDRKIPYYSSMFLITKLAELQLRIQQLENKQHETN